MHASISEPTWRWPGHRAARVTGRGIWLVWGAGGAAALWAAFDPSGRQLVPIVVVVTLTGLMLSHFAVPGAAYGLVAGFVLVLLIPSFDLLLDPPCEALQLQKRPDGTTISRCVQVEGAQRDAGLLIAAALLGGAAIALMRWRSSSRGGPQMAAASKEGDRV